jgi:hypothetical protein
VVGSRRVVDGLISGTGGEAQDGTELTAEGMEAVMRKARDVWSPY